MLQKIQRLLQLQHRKNAKTIPENVLCTSLPHGKIQDIKKLQLIEYDFYGEVNASPKEKD